MQLIQRSVSMWGDRGTHDDAMMDVGRGKGH